MNVHTTYHVPYRIHTECVHTGLRITTPNNFISVLDDTGDSNRHTNGDTTCCFVVCFLQRVCMEFDRKFMQHGICLCLKSSCGEMQMRLHLLLGAGESLLSIVLTPYDNLC